MRLDPRLTLIFQLFHNFFLQFLVHLEHPINPCQVTWTFQTFPISQKLYGKLVTQQVRLQRFQHFPIYQKDIPKVPGRPRLLPAADRKWENMSKYKNIYVKYNFLFCHMIWTLFFSLFPMATAKTCSGGLVLFGRRQNHRCLTGH